MTSMFEQSTSSCKVFAPHKVSNAQCAAHCAITAPANVDSTYCALQGNAAPQAMFEELGQEHVNDTDSECSSAEHA